MLFTSTWSFDIEDESRLCCLEVVLIPFEILSVVVVSSETMSLSFSSRIFPSLFVVCVVGTLILPSSELTSTLLYRKQRIHITMHELETVIPEPLLELASLVFSTSPWGSTTSSFWYSGSRQIGSRGASGKVLQICPFGLQNHFWWKKHGSIKASRIQTRCGGQSFPSFPHFSSCPEKLFHCSNYTLYITSTML